jgi:hypothetical protein
LTAREQKIILYLVAKLNPTKQTDFYRQTIPVTTLESILKSDDKKWGGLYSEMEQFAERVMTKYIKFPTDFMIEGKPFKGFVSWFQSVRPVLNDQDEVCLQFTFAEDLKPFLLQLSEYVKLDRMEIAPIKSGHAIHIYSILKAHRDRMKAHEAISYVSYDIQQLKNVLGIPDKYPRIDDFKRRVLDSSLREINEYSSLDVSYENIKAKRRVIGIKFIIKDKRPDGDKPVSDIQIEKLSRAQLKAFEILTEFGVKDGIAYFRILPKIEGTEFDGFEDYFIENCLDHFEKKARANNPGAFVKWFLDKKAFSVGTPEWSKIAEKVVALKKNLENENPNKFDNRMIAKNMTNSEFEKWYKSQKG